MGPSEYYKGLSTTRLGKVFALTSAKMIKKTKIYLITS